MTLLFIFLLVVLALLALDLGVFHRKAKEVSLREAWGWSAIWIALAVLFGVFLYFNQGSGTATEYFSVYFIEKALAIDNVFVFSLVFAYFVIPRQYQHKVLFYGIIGAILFRALFIGAGSALLTRFDWIYYLFGAFLIYSGYLMFKAISAPPSLEGNKLIGWLNRTLPVTPNLEDDKLFLKKAGKWFVTPLFIALLFIELSDILFAVDSVAASFAYSDDPYVIFYANIMAILGLRSLYFVLDGMISRFHYLKHGLSFMLVFIGLKMVLSDFYKMPLAVSLGAIVLVVVSSILFSFYKTRR
ncbi:TerC/Alx family metal homeostasis membrane protein [Exiguobacterium flavidum]|uniref:TerC/Alx family metal homeostasis membrane protein n=1 Tax=Exiguobacterium flavidum TaxID=2184695 RepID=UPI000DF7224C|nr:TerC/Alx family metal homeostasis membrane protein [Exiguobacterium flavidum]